MRFHLNPSKREWVLLCDSPTFRDYLGNPIRFEVELCLNEDAEFVDDKYACWVHDLGWDETHELSDPHLTHNLDAWDHTPPDFEGIRGDVNGWEFKCTGFRFYRHAAYDLVIWVVEMARNDPFVHVRLIERRFID